MKNFKKGRFYVPFLFLSAIKAEDKPPSSLEECWHDNEKCMSHINTFSQQTVNYDWLSKFAPEKIRKELFDKAATDHSNVNSSTKWKISSAEGKTHIESLTESLKPKDQKEKLPSMSNEEWAKHCNDIFNKCEASLAPKKK